MKSARNARVRLIATLVALAVIVGAVVAIVIGATRHSTATANSTRSDVYVSGAVPTVDGSLPIPGSALASVRADVAAAANAFVNAQWTWDPSMLQGETMPAFRAAIAVTVTPKFQETINQWAALTETAAKSHFKGTVKIWSTGIAAVSADKATALVVGARTNLVPKTEGGTDYQSLGEEPFRLVVSLVKIDGKWLVDAEAPAEGAPSTSATPTSGATK